MRRRWTAAWTLLALVALLGCEDPGDGDDETAAPTDEPEDGDAVTDVDTVEVVVVDGEGERIGNILLLENADAVVVEATLADLEPGFHGFHVHETGECDPAASDGPFTTAGGHLAPGGEDHGGHDGDLPPLLVDDDGSASLSFHTDRVTIDDLTEGDGTAFVVHGEPDNLGHVPDRYTSEEADEPGPDEDTRATGDAGTRVACGEVVGNADG